MTDEGVAIVSAWEFDRDVHPGVAAQAAFDESDVPDLEVALVSEGPDFKIVQVLEGELQDARNAIFLACRGLHRVVCTVESLPLNEADRAHAPDVGAAAREVTSTRTFREQRLACRTSLARAR